jgi:hypothetical protein
VTLKATDAAGTGVTCDPAIVTVGRGPGERPSRCSTTSLWAKATSRWSTAGPASTDYASRSTATSSSSRTWWGGQTQTLDLSSAMRRGARNTVVVVAHGPRDSSATVMVSDV